MFANAPIATAPKVAKTAKKDDMVAAPGLELYAALCAVKKNIEANMSVVQTGINAEAMERFIEAGMRTKAKPESYKGFEGQATGSIQLRCRSILSAVSPEEVEILEAEGIPLDKNVSREETFIINPAYADLTDETNAAMLSKVEEALAGLGLPKDFIQRQTAVEKVIATEKSIEAVVSLTDRAKVAALLPLVTCQAIRPTLAANANPFAIVEAALGSPTA